MLSMSNAFRLLVEIYIVRYDQKSIFLKNSLKGGFLDYGIKSIENGVLIIDFNC